MRKLIAFNDTIIVSDSIEAVIQNNAKQIEFYTKYSGGHGYVLNLSCSTETDSAMQEIAKFLSDPNGPAFLALTKNWDFLNKERKQTEEPNIL